jgi:glycosyltransferase involved in cell wall biosynthesis
MHSEDKTIEIAKSFGANIVYHEKTGYAGPARRYAISNAAYEWVLVIDADEVMTEKLAEKLKEIVREDKVDVVFFGILYNYFGKFIRHGGFFNNKNHPRLFRKRVYMETYDRRDEVVDREFFNLREKAKNRIRLPLEYFIEHYPYPTIKSYVDKTIGKYALIGAQNMFDTGEKFKLYMLIFEPLKVFVMAYIVRAGFLDGIEGFILATLYAAYRFTTWANLWYLEKNR